MPETVDWSAAPQSAVLSASRIDLVPPAGLGADLIVPTAGRRTVLVGVDMYAANIAIDDRALRGIVTVELFDAVTLARMYGLSISPGAPFASSRPPFGSVRTAVGNGVGFQYNVELGIGKQYAGLLFYWYTE